MIKKKHENFNRIFTPIPFSITPPGLELPHLGLIALKTDLTIEDEMRFFFKNCQLSLLSSRIDCQDQVSKKGLKNMRLEFKDSLNLFPPKHKFDVIAYGCTSGALMIGEEKIENMIKSEVNVDNVTTPMKALKRALISLNVKNIGYLSPYVSDISERMCAELENNKVSISAYATFSEDLDSIVGRIEPESIFRAILTLVKNSKPKKLDAIFVSCTSLKCSSIIKKAEIKLGIPILSSNSVLAWDMAKLANIKNKALYISKIFDS